MKFRTCVWPCNPPPRHGVPVVEYLTRADLLARGWSEHLIRAVLGAPCGTRSNLNYYRLDRVTEAEKGERVRAGFARAARRAAAAGREAPRPPDPAAPDDRPLLAVTMSQVLSRGWTDDMVLRLMPQPDVLEHAGSGLLEPQYLAARVQAVETSPAFREAMAPIEAERARAREEEERRWAQWRAEREAEHRQYEAERERLRLRQAAFREVFPDFDVDVVAFNRGWGGEMTINGQRAKVHSTDFCALARGCAEARNWAPVVDWLLEHEEFGDRRFRAALGYLAVGDRAGWDAWCRAGGLTTTPEDRKWAAAQRDRERTWGRDPVVLAGQDAATESAPSSLAV